MFACLLACLIACLLACLFVCLFVCLAFQKTIHLSDCHITGLLPEVHKWLYWDLIVKQWVYHNVLAKLHPMNLGFWYCVWVISCHGTHSFGYILVMLTIIQNSIFCPCGFSFRNPFLTPKAIHSHPMKFMLPSHPHPPIPGPTSLLLQPRPARHARLAFPRPAPRLCGQSSQACAGYGCTTSVLTPVIYIYIFDLDWHRLT